MHSIRAVLNCHHIPKVIHGFFSLVLGYANLLVTALLILNVGMSLTTQEANSKEREKYIKVSVVFFVDMLRLLISLFMLFTEEGCSIRNFLRTIKKNTIDQPREVLKLSVPAGLFFMQSLLSMHASGNLPQIVQQVSRMQGGKLTGFHSQTADLLC